MKIIKLWGLVVAVSLLQACMVPGSTRSSQFDATARLDGTIWCGPLTTRPVGGYERFMAVYFLGGKAGLARGRTREEAVREVKKLTSVSFTAYQSTGSHIFIPGFWDDGFNHKGGLGRVNAEVVFTSNSSAQIRMYHSTDPNASLIYEVSDACKYY